MKQEQQVWRRGLPFSAEVAPYLRHMPQVDEHREELMRLQGVWDSLALLGQMSGAATEIADTRSAFQALAGRLLDSLARRQLANARRQLAAKAQVAIDILVRNLFERTADVGFLAADAPLAALAEAGAAASPEQRAALEARFAAYVAKYSVYDDIVVLSPQGLVLARLDRRVQQSPCADTLIAAALRPGVPFVERHGASDILGGRCGLLFASAIRNAAGQPVGVLCLSFKLEDEMRGVFAQLLGSDERGLLALTDAAGRVVLSSDPWQLPAGARAQAGAGGRLVFAGRDYLAAPAAASGYEGYMGPGWSALALLPLEHAFGGEEQGGTPAGSHGALADGLDTRELFDAELRGIPQEAQRIQRDLSRSLWNGKLRSRAHAQDGAGGQGFAITLLNEVERTGQQLRQTFEQAIGNLHHAALDAVFDAARFHARLAIDIMDRNLYERANDCRWWALDAALQQVLGEGGSVAEASARLQHINSLYTVYALLLIFDAEGRVVAVSDPAQRTHLGKRLEQDWVRATLALGDRERYAVSAHGPSGLYGREGQEATYIYAAGLPAAGDGLPGQGSKGGIAVVFDGQPQFAAMLRDALPAGSGAAGLLVNRAGRVVASTDEARWPVGSSAPLGKSQLQDLAAGQTAQAELELDGVVHAVGLAMSGGYREYRQGAPRGDEDVAAVMLLPLGPRLAQAGEGAGAATRFEAPPAPRADEAQLDIASFIVDGQLLGLPAQQAVEALERARLTGLPNAPAGVVGLLEHGGRMLPVLDLGQQLYGRPCEADAPVLVCRSAAGQLLGLRVQELGQVFAVAADAARASPLAGAAGGGEFAPRLVRGGAGSTAMLTLLSAEALWGQLGGPVGALVLPAETPLLTAG